MPKTRNLATKLLTFVWIPLATNDPDIQVIASWANQQPMSMPKTTPPHMHTFPEPFSLYMAEPPELRCTHFNHRCFYNKLGPLDRSVPHLQENCAQGLGSRRQLLAADNWGLAANACSDAMLD